VSAGSDRLGTVARGVAAVGESVAATAGLPEGARDVLQSLRQTVPFDCAAIATVRADGLHLLAQVDCPTGFDRGLRTPEYRAEHAALRMLRPGRPLRFSDLPCGGRTSFTATELAWPVGLRGGLGMALYSADGREVGFVSLNTEARDVLTELHRDILGLLGGLLAQVADVPGAVARRHGGRAFISADGDIVPLPDARPIADFKLVRAIRDVVMAGVRTGSFLHPTRRRGRWLRLRLEPFGSEQTGASGAVLHLDDVGAPYGLTPSELKVLTLLTRGLSNRAIADMLVVAPGTVRTHVESVLAKLGVANRTEAAVTATREGLVLFTATAASQRSVI
jgi:DNA-binding CsgD family transcriptional regulator